MAGFHGCAEATTHHTHDRVFAIALENNSEQSNGIIEVHILMDILLKYSFMLHQVILESTFQSMKSQWVSGLNHLQDLKAYVMVITVSAPPILGLAGLSLWDVPDGSFQMAHILLPDIVPTEPVQIWLH